MEINDKIYSHLTDTESSFVQKPDEMDKESHTKVLIERGIDPNKNLTPLEVIIMYKKESIRKTRTSLNGIEKRQLKISSDEPNIKVARKKLEQLSF